MAGKLDSSAYAVAIAKMGEAAKHESDVWRHLDEIVKGVAFKGSPRSQAFLNRDRQSGYRQTIKAALRRLSQEEASHERCNPEANG